MEEEVLGKSFATSLYLANKLLTSNKNLLYLRQTMTSAATSVIPQFLQQVKVLNLEKNLQVTANEISSKNSSGILYFKGFQTSSGNQDSNLKSIPNLETVLIEEASEILEEPFDRLNFSIRDKDANVKIILALNPSHVNHWIYRRFFKETGISFDFNGISGNVLYIHTTYLDNLKNLDETFLKEIETIKSVNPLKYSNIFLGDWLSTDSNSLWTLEMIKLAHKEIQLPKFVSDICIGIDIAVTSNKDSDKTSFCVVQKTESDYFVLESLAEHWSPLEWANKCKELKEKYPSAKIVAEKNQGGEMITETLRHVGIQSVELVTATKSKLLRASDIIALYEQGKVHHMKMFTELESQMLSYSGNGKEDSPDSLDSLVWALKKLSTTTAAYVGY